MPLLCEYCLPFVKVGGMFLALKGPNETVEDAMEHVKLLVLCGATAGKIRAAVEQAPGYRPGHPEILEVTPFQRAVEAARDRAQPGDVVTLSPACAAFDQFKNFMVRGETYKTLVRAL